jgi:preprotein translocase subunit SecF
MLLRPTLRLVPDGTRIKFMRGRFLGLLTSAVLSLASLVLFFHPGLHLGIDFAGGIVMEVRTPGPADTTALRTALEAAGIRAAGLQRFGDASQVAIRLDAQATPAATEQAVQAVRGALEKACTGQQGRTHGRGWRLGVERAVP